MPAQDGISALHWSHNVFKQRGNPLPAAHERGTVDITTTTEGSTTTLALDGWLDTNTAPQLEAALSALDQGCDALVIDLEKLEYISSAGLRQLVSAYKQMRGKLTICNVSPEVMQVISMASLNKRLRIV